jgi:hypothetical protein
MSHILKPVDYDQFAVAALQPGLYWMVLNAPLPGKIRGNQKHVVLA